MHWEEDGNFSCCWNYGVFVRDEQKRADTSNFAGGRYFSIFVDIQRGGGFREPDPLVAVR